MVLPLEPVMHILPALVYLAANSISQVKYPGYDEVCVSQPLATRSAAWGSPEFRNIKFRHWGLKPRCTETAFFLMGLYQILCEV